MLWNLKYLKLSYSKARYFKDASLLKQMEGKWVVNTKKYHHPLQYGLKLFY